MNLFPLNNLIAKGRLHAFLVLLLCGGLYLFASCRKTGYDTDASDTQIGFSADTLIFDTVFTTQGSATRTIKIFNNATSRIKITAIRLAKGTNSPFYINVNGQSGKTATDIPIEGKDSVYVFAGVHIDPNAADAPFIVEDSLVVTANGKDFSVPVLAYGQNAVYITDSVLATQSWNSPRPYVIIHNAEVGDNQTLTIPAGARVYFHADSRLFVVGTLKVQGTKEDSVVFQGDRIDRLAYAGDYIDLPGEWGGLYFTADSKASEINYLILKNGGAATTLGSSTVLPASIQLDADSVPTGTPKLTIQNSIIANSYGYGILAFHSTLKMQNCLVHTCGQENVALLQGGTYQLYNNTIANYGSTYLPSSTSQHVSLVLENYFYISNTEYVGAALEADLKNNIIYGYRNDEFFADKKSDFSATVDVSHCLIKSGDAIATWVNMANNGNILNQDPLFTDDDKWDFTLQATSPAKGAGTYFSGILPLDLLGISRNNPPSIGCYE